MTAYIRTVTWHNHQRVLSRPHTASTCW